MIVFMSAFSRKYQLAICERFRPLIHGWDENSSPNILNHYLVVECIDKNDFYSNAYLEDLELIRLYHRNRECQIQLDIIQLDELTPGLEEVAYIKTFWLRIVQRKWKKIFQERKELIKKRSQFKALKERQLTGCWPVSLRNWPEFKLGLN